MRAFVLTRYGGPEAARLQDVPAPEPGPRELQIRVHAAGLNPVDYKIREGKLRGLFRPRLPAVLGNELSGLVMATGADVRGFEVGDRVMVRVDKFEMGAFAEVACVDASLAAQVPEALDLTAAAGVPLAGLTALQCLRDELQVKPGYRLFVSGGAGGVGTFALQLAKHLGAHVTTTASPRGEALVRRLGADEVIDYTTTRFWDVLSGMDGVLDLMGQETLERSFEILRPGGRVVSVAGVPEPETARRDLAAGAGLAGIFWLMSLPLRRRAARHGVSYCYKFMLPSGPDLAFLAGLLANGRLEVVVDRVHPFSEIEQAFERLESGRSKGKVIVRMGDET